MSTPETHQRSDKKWYRWDGKKWDLVNAPVDNRPSPMETVRNTQLIKKGSE